MKKIIKFELVLETQEAIDKYNDLSMTHNSAQPHNVELQLWNTCADIFETGDNFTFVVKDKENLED